MKAVNLIPAESRRTSASAGRSGGAAHAVLGVLALAVVALALLTLTGRQVEERRAEAARVAAEAQAVDARAGLLGPYREFAELAAARAQRVRQLAEGRFDWSFALTEVARVVPRDVRLVRLVGTVAPGAGGTGGGASALRQAVPAPAIEMTGCTPSQGRTALLLARLRALDGVQRVAVSASEKADEQLEEAAQDATGADPAEADDCRAGSDRIPQFELVVFFRGPAGGTAAAAGAATPATPAAPSGSTQAPATPAPESTPATTTETAQ